MIRIIPLLLTLGLVWGCGKSSSEGDPGMGRVVRDDVVVTVMGHGKVESEFNRTITPPRAWGLKITTLIAEGTKVKKGDVIITLDTSDLDKRLREDASDLKAGLAILDNAGENLKVVRERVQARVDKAQANFRIATLEWETVQAGYTEAAITKARLLVAKAAEQAEHARTEMENWRTLAEKGVASKAELEAKQLNHEQARIELERLRLQLALLEAGSTPAELRRAELNLALAKLDLDAATDQAAYEIDRATQERVKAEAVLQLRQQKHDTTQRLIEQCTMTAPVDGSVFYEQINTREGVEKIREGTEVRPWDRLVSLPDVSHLLIRIKVDESRVADVRKGQPALVTLESLRGESFSGTVQNIDPVARAQTEDQPSQEEVRREEVATKVFDVLVAFDKADPRLAPGLSGEAQIVTARLSQVLVVPVQAVYQVDGQPVVYVDDDGAVRTARVKLGPEDNDRVVVEEGLSEGQRIYLQLPPGIEPEGGS